MKRGALRLKSVRYCFKLTATKQADVRGMNNPPISPTLAWSVILLSNEDGKSPTEKFLSKASIEAIDRWIAVPRFGQWTRSRVITCCALVGDDITQELNKLRGAVLIAQDRLASFMHDNTDEDVLFEDAHPEIDGIRSFLLEFVS
jgi:hypothetical protein